MVLANSDRDRSLPAASDSSSDPIVLLVDDDPINLHILFETLGDAGFRLLAAESGEAALEQASLCQPDIILLDVMMPGMDGFETCRRLKSDPVTTNIPVIFMTALADTLNKIQGLSIGAVDYITKPIIQLDEVLARIKTHLTVAELRQQLQIQNEQLRQEIQERKQVEQSLQLLLRSVSHDLRNPVSGMIMVLNNLLEKASLSNTDADQPVPSNSGSSNSVASNPGSPNPGSSTSIPPNSDTIVVPRRLLEQMASSGDRQLQLINSLLETHTHNPSHNPSHNHHQSPTHTPNQNPKSKIQNSAAPTLTLELHREPVAIAPLIDSIIQDIQPLLQTHPATLTCHIADDLPQANADPTQLWRVLENLITNAIKHNPPDVRVILTVLTASSNRPESPFLLQFTVQDNGVGISPMEQETLFEPYQRGTGVGKPPGLGLGLYLCQQIVAAHGGELEVISQPNNGTTFWFTLPLVDS